MKERYIIVPKFFGYLIVDTILNKTISPMYDTKKYAKENLNRMITNGELKQIVYKEKELLK